MAAEDMAPFGSESEAREAYFGEDETDSGPDDESDVWAEPEILDELEGGWTLREQQLEHGDRTRYFVTGGPFELPHAITSGGGTEEISEGQTYEETPSFDTEEDARAAHQTWLEEYDGNTEGEQWTDWEEHDMAPPWYVYVRRKKQTDERQFTISGLRDGDRVYLAPEAEILPKMTEATLYSSMDAVVKALDAYFQADQNGDVPEEQKPTGGRPNPADLPDGPEDDDSDEEDDGLLSGLSGIIDAVAGNPIAIFGLLVVLAVLYAQYGGKQ